MPAVVPLGTIAVSSAELFGVFVVADYRIFCANRHPMCFVWVHDLILFLALLSADVRVSVPRGGSVDR